MALTTVISGLLHFPSRPMGDPLPGKAPLNVGKILAVDHKAQDVELLTILGFPPELKPGKYKVSVEPRAKSGKPGMNLWFVHAEPEGT